MMLHFLFIMLLLVSSSSSVTRENSMVAEGRLDAAGPRSGFTSAKVEPAGDVSGCNCPVSTLMRINSNASCFNCVFDDKKRAIINIGFSNNYSSSSPSLFVSFTNCTFRHQHVAAMLPYNSNHTQHPFLSLRFVNCTFEDTDDYKSNGDVQMSDNTGRDGNRTDTEDSNKSPMVRLFSDFIGSFDLSITGCTFINGIYGAIDVEALEQTLPSSVLISQSHFEMTRGKSSHNNNDAVDKDRVVHSHYSAMTIDTSNTSVLIEDCTFVAWSLKYSSDNNSQKQVETTVIVEEEKKRNRTHSKSNVIKNTNSQFQGAAIEGRSTGDNLDHNGSTLTPQLNSITISSCKFINNSAFGGAIHLSQGLMIVVNSTFEGNRGALGGAVSVSPLSGQERFVENMVLSPPTAVFSDNCRFVDNSASLEGGAVYASSNDRLEFSKVVFSGNSAIYGAAVSVDDLHSLQGSHSRTSFSDCVFESRNHAVSPGIGIVYVLGGVVFMSNSTVSYEYDQRGQVFFSTEDTLLNATSVVFDGIDPINMRGGSTSFIDVSISRSQVNSVLLFI